MPRCAARQKEAQVEQPPKCFRELSRDEITFDRRGRQSRPLAIPRRPHLSHPSCRGFAIFRFSLDTPAAGVCGLLFTPAMPATPGDFGEGNPTVSEFIVR